MEQVRTQCYLIAVDVLFCIPSDPRLNITVKNKTSTSIAVTWYPIQQSDHLKWENISGYRVSLKNASNGNRSRDYFLCQAAQALILKNLQVYTNYCINVASFAGRRIIGNNSQCLFATTGEEGNVYVK